VKDDLPESLKARQEALKAACAQSATALEASREKSYGLWLSCLGL
jgi:hypothetical protein